MALMLTSTESKTCQRTTKDYRKLVVFANILPIFKSSLPPEDDVTQKMKSWNSIIHFHVLSKIVVVPALTNLFQKVKNEHFENRYSYFVPRYQGKEYAPIIVGSTVESCLRAVEKHKEFASSASSQQLMLRKQLWPHLFSDFCECFLMYLMMLSVGT